MINALTLILKYRLDWYLLLKEKITIAVCLRRPLTQSCRKGYETEYGGHTFYVLLHRIHHNADVLSMNYVTICLTSDSYSTPKLRDIRASSHYPPN